MKCGDHIDPEIKKKHEEILWTVVRVRTDKAGGSGTLICSKQREDGEYESYVLTNHHVIESCYAVAKKWDPLVGMEVKKEVTSPVTVEFFDYENFSRCKGVRLGTKAKIVAVNPEEDMALLKIDKTTKLEPVATMYPIGKHKEVHVYDSLFACGASLLHVPLTTKGILVHMDDIIENYRYWMTTAQTIYGNSGGAVFRYSPDRNKYEYIGIPSRISVTGWGGATPITQEIFGPSLPEPKKVDPVSVIMGYFIPIPRIYRFLENFSYQFIWDDLYTIEQCHEMRAKKREESKKLMTARFGEVQK